MSIEDQGGIPKTPHREVLDRIMLKSVISRQLTSPQKTAENRYHYDEHGKLIGITHPEDDPPAA